VENYQEYQLQQQQKNYRLDKDMLMDKTKPKRKYYKSLRNNARKVYFTTFDRSVIHNAMMTSAAIFQKLCFITFNIYLHVHYLCVCIAKRLKYSLLSACVYMRKKWDFSRRFIWNIVLLKWAMTHCWPREFSNDVFHSRNIWYSCEVLSSGYLAHSYKNK
jgi:hypothetical protein